MASRGSIAFAGCATVPWGDPRARCIRPGPPCAQYTTVAEDPRLVMFEVDVRTPGDRGFVRVMVHLHTPEPRLSGARVEPALPGRPAGGPPPVQP
jgi:hypothetical protein